MANTLITLKNASLAFGDYPLLDNTDFSVQEGERIGLIGRNGTGKSSMLQVLARKSALDDGEIQVKDGLRVVLLEQEPVFPPAPTIRESLIAQSGFDPSDDKLYWKQIAKLDAYLQRLNVRADADPGTASGGERKKAAIALVLAQEPDLLLLDEPTNHLDITTIALLEDLIRETFKNTRALVVITHDREFLDAVSTRIVELDRGILRSYPGKLGEDYTIDEKQKTVAPTEAGVSKMEKMLKVDNLYDTDNLELNHLFVQALRAQAMMERDRDYVVKDGEVVIVDEFTGRLMYGRRYSDGLHQAIEAKEGLQVQRESQTLATITFQNYFRMYDKLAGMTGTAKTEEQEFIKIYGLEVFQVPTNRPVQRKDLPDVIFKTKRGKYRAVVREIERRHATGQPMLIGTTSIEQSEQLSHMLKEAGIVHNVLNAKYHELEAQIVAQAGQKGQVTIATNMAGRGTDIVLGEGVSELGGLAIIGTERHESRRIDNQLRGRAGRQGDPGSSQFFLSLEDDLLRIFGGDNIKKFMEKMGLEEDEEIRSSMVSSAIQKAQKRVEERNFDIRKYVLEYDDVMNQQRKVVYEQRRKILEGQNMKDQILNMVDMLINHGLETYANPKLYPEEWDFDALIKYYEKYFLAPGEVKLDEIENMSREEIGRKLMDIAHETYEAREKSIGSSMMRELEKAVMLKVVDSKWMEHLDDMDMLKEGIGLRSYGQRNPIVEYKVEAFNIFSEMQQSMIETIILYLYHIQIQFTPSPENDDPSKKERIDSSVNNSEVSENDK